MTAEDNHLPPDNFQEDPLPVVAHRTSPTNIGLYLLSTVAARDFGWLGLQATCDRLGTTLASLQKLERFRGHFLNWYDTRSLVALLPHYVSTVDSGNLAGHLLTLRQACLAMRDAPLLSARALYRSTGCPRPVSPRAAGSAPAVAAAGARPANCMEALRHIDAAAGAPHAPRCAAATATLHAAASDIAAQLRQDNAPLPADATRWLASAGQDIAFAAAGPAGPGRSASALPRDVTLERAGAAVTAAPRWPHCWGNRARNAVRWRQSMSFGFLYDRAVPDCSPSAIAWPIASWTKATTTCWPPRRGSASLVAIAQGRRAVLALVPARAAPHWRLAPAGAGLLVRLDVRVPDADAGDAGAAAQPAGPDQSPRGARSRSPTASGIGLPWGISESAWNVRDREYTYQYSAFGLPTLGLKRGLGADYVVAPYATALAAMYRAGRGRRRTCARSAEPVVAASTATTKRWTITTARVPEGKSVAVVHAYMAHHQGMSLVALDNALHDDVMQARFHRRARHHRRGPAAAGTLHPLRSRRPALIEARCAAAHELR